MAKPKYTYYQVLNGRLVKVLRRQKDEYNFFLSADSGWVKMKSDEYNVNELKLISYGEAFKLEQEIQKEYMGADLTLEQFAQ